MSDVSRLLPALLASAVKAARAALRRLEADEIPASLRRIAAYSGGRLPPPLARSLLDELDASEWLRDKALEELGSGDGPGRIYLERPPGWALALVEAAAARSAGEAAEELAAVQRRAAEAEQRLAEARRRRRDERASARSAAGDADADELRGKLKVAYRRLAVESERREAEVREAGDRAEAVGEAAAALAAEVQRLRAQLRRARRDRARLEAASQPAPGGATRRRRPIELARDLDAAAQLLPAAPAPSGATTAPAAAALPELPRGVRPDDAAAIDWLVEEAGPLLLLVDGYNVTFSLSERGFATPEARQRLNAELARLARLAAGLRVVVVYDSDQEGDAAVAAGPGGVEVVFAPADLLADEELVARAAAATVPTVVVSTDREVREGAEEAGALALWGEALVAWTRRRT